MRRAVFVPITFCIALFIPAAASGETWTGTWNAPNLWRSVDLTIENGSARFRAGTAGEKVEAVTRRFSLDDTTLTAELGFLETVVLLQGRVAQGGAAGDLTVTRGGTVLTRGVWHMERRGPADRSAAEIVQHVRKRLFRPGRLAAGYTVTQVPAGGTAAEAPGWTARVGARGEIAVSENGAPALLGDGTSIFLHRDPFGWMPSESRLQEKLWLVEMLRSGAWLAEHAPLRFTAWTTDEGRGPRYVLEVTTPAGIVPAAVVINPDTWLPESAGVAWDAGERSMRFADYTDHGGCLFPAKLTLGYRGREQEWRTTELARGAGSFEPPASGDTSYDRDAPATLAGTLGRAEGDHLFVRPTVMGREVGWFHVDTGAPFIILDVKTAEELGLEILRDMGPRSVRLLPEIRVGQLTLRDQPVLVQDLSGFSAPESTVRAGVIGGPVFEHSIVVYDYPGRSVSVFAPEAFHERVDHWQPLRLDGAPVVEASFDGRGDRFYIDTGKSGTVSFLSHDAAQAGLFRPAMVEAPNETVEGASVELVTHLDSFTLAGMRFEHPEVRVKLPGTANDDLGFGLVAGIVGRGFFGERRVVFDYGGGRIGFAASRADRGGAAAAPRPRPRSGRRRRIGDRTRESRCRTRATPPRSPRARRPAPPPPVPRGSSASPRG